MITLFKDPFFSVFDEVYNTNTTIKTPQSTIKKDEDSYKIYMTVPGLSKEDIKISCKERILKISYEKEKNSDNFNFVNSFTKTYRLSEDIDEDEINGKVENGILELILPLSQSQIKERTIYLN